MARRVVFTGAVWIAVFSACAFAQDRSVPQRTQVVLIARLPDTFAVNSRDALASVTTTQPGASSDGITLHASGQLIPGTSATTACFVRTLGQTMASEAFSIGDVTSEGKLLRTAGVQPPCDGRFRTLKEPADSIAIKTQALENGDRSTAGRLDVIFSIL